MTHIQPARATQKTNPVSSYGSILAKKGDVRGRELINAAIRYARANPWHLDEVASALSDVGDPRAGSTFDDAIKFHRTGLSPDGKTWLTAEGRPRFEERARYLSSVALALARAHDDRSDAIFAEALDAVPRIENKRHHPPREDYLHKLALDMARAGNRYAEDVLEQAVRAQREANRDFDDVFLLTEVALGLLPADRSAAEVLLDVCTTVVDDIHDSPGDTRGTEKRMEAHFDLGLALAKAKDGRGPAILRKSVELAREVRKSFGALYRSKYAMLDYVAQVLSQTADPRVKPLLEEVIEEAVAKARQDRDYPSLARVAKLLSHDGDPRANTIFQEAVDGALAAVKQRAGTAGSLRAVAVELRDLDPGKSRGLLEEVVKRASDFGGGGSSSVAAQDLTARALALVDLGRFHEPGLLETQNWFRGEYLAGGTIRRMYIETCILQNDFERARKVLEQMGNLDAYDNQAPTEWVRAFVGFRKGTS